MKRQGTLIRWEKDRGFGFIRCPEASTDVFVHLRDFMDRGTVPQIGMRLTFEEIHVGGKGPRAVAVQVAGTAQERHPQRSPQPDAVLRTRAVRAGRSLPPTMPSPRSRASGLAMAALLAVYLLLLGHGVQIGRIAPITLGILLLISLLTFFIYGFDKHAAETGRWRTRENTLHLLSLAGGWPGAWWAQGLFRHKIRKTGFMAGYWATALTHVAAAGAWIGGLLPGA